MDKNQHGYMVHIVQSECVLHWGKQTKGNKIGHIKQPEMTTLIYLSKVILNNSQESLFYVAHSHLMYI